VGMTIHYTLTVRNQWSKRTIREKLETLRQFCLDLPVEAVGEFPSHAQVFTIDLAPGCEEMALGICTYPGGRRMWASSCCTQYANEYGLPNFLRAHVSACAILEKAQELGFKVDVEDEGEYWTKRDDKALAEKVVLWDQILAGLHGLAKDVLPADLMPENPMAWRADFERLEFHAHRLGRIGKLLGKIRNLLGYAEHEPPDVDDWG